MKNFQYNQGRDQISKQISLLENEKMKKQLHITWLISNKFHV